VAGIPSVLLGILLQYPSLDVQWEIPWAHLVLVTAAGLAGMILAVLIWRVAVALDNARLVLVALAFYVMGIFLLLHALLTPETLLAYTTTGAEIAAVVGFFTCSAFLAASSLTLSPGSQRAVLRNTTRLAGGITLLALVMAALALSQPGLLGNAPVTANEYGNIDSRVNGGISLITLCLLAAATVPYYKDFRLTGLRFPETMTTGLLALQVAAVAFIVSSVWRVRW
jgi:hypothetical protein